jgi:hypothetical protein
MVAADVVELDSVVVEVVEDGKAELIALAVVGLGNATAENEVEPFLDNSMKNSNNELNHFYQIKDTFFYRNVLNDL